ncbi:MAG: phosphomannomutase [Hydrogenophilales bacterium 28-61-23]|nr:MAG: phosphomannomutase [Hydrogenophilales bacterium 28-61-23]
MPEPMHHTLRIQQLMDSSGVRFGTSGARGLVADMSAQVCFAYTTAFLRVVDAPEGGRVALGMDLRPSSPDIARACAAAIRQAGFEPDFCGVLPTPALAFYAQERGIPAIMVTGSHIPFDRNGIKFYRASGEITKADEAGISGATVELPAELQLESLPAINDEARRMYIERYLDFFPRNVLAGMRLGFYEHSSVARDLLRDIMQGLGARVISLGRTDQFVPIDTEAVAEVDIQQARRWAVEHGFDAICSTDGDADRPLLGDEHGDWLRGDVVGILCAQYLGAEAVATPVSSNTALEKCGAFARVRRTRIGSPFVIEGMEKLSADGAQRVVGFEANGGFLVGSRLEKSGRALQPLPTRDAVLPILALLAAARELGIPLSQLPARLPPRFTASDRIQNFATEKSRQLLETLAGSETELRDFLAPLGVEPAGIDQTDGLRISLANGEIVHLRPSGNAPELRCYAEAEHQARAGELACACLKLVQARG